MTAEHRTIWTCNRCKVEKSKPHQSQPVGWQRIGISQVGIPNGSLVTWGDLCGDCRRGHELWLCSPPRGLASDEEDAS